MDRWQLHYGTVEMLTTGYSVAARVSQQLPDEQLHSGIRTS